MNIKFIGKAKITKQGQVTLPFEARTDLKLEPESEVYWYLVDDHLVVVKDLVSVEDLIKIVNRKRRQNAVFEPDRIIGIVKLNPIHTPLLEKAKAPGQDHTFIDVHTAEQENLNKKQLSKEFPYKFIIFHTNIGINWFVGFGSAALHKAPL